MPGAGAANGSSGDGTTSTEPGARIETDLAADGTTIVVAVDGELTMLSSPELKAGLVAAMQRPGGAVVVDLSHCTFIDSSGLNALAHASLLGRQPAHIALVVTRPHL